MPLKCFTGDAFGLTERNRCSVCDGWKLRFTKECRQKGGP